MSYIRKDSIYYTPKTPIVNKKTQKF